MSMKSKTFITIVISLIVIGSVLFPRLLMYKTPMQNPLNGLLLEEINVSNYPHVFDEASKIIWSVQIQERKKKTPVIEVPKEPEQLTMRYEGNEYAFFIEKRWYVLKGVVQSKGQLRAFLYPETYDVGLPFLFLEKNQYLTDHIRIDAIYFNRLDLNNEKSNQMITIELKTHDINNYLVEE